MLKIARQTMSRGILNMRTNYMERLIASPIILNMEDL